jgi:hypothetical protein
VDLIVKSVFGWAQAMHPAVQRWAAVDFCDLL